MPENSNRYGGGEVLPLNDDERIALAGRIRNMLAELTLSYTWLIHRLSDEGVLTDKFEMSATMSGARRGKKADEILRRSFAILNEYRECMGLREDV